MALEQAIIDLESAVESSATAAATETTIRERLQRVRAMMAEPLKSRDGWLVARAEHADRDRCALLERISSMTKRISESALTSGTLTELRRLAHDLTRYQQRVHDLDYDAVELELGGFD